MGEREEDGLPPCGSAGLRHDRRNHVDKLGKTGGLHPVRVVEKRDAGAAEGQRILHGIDFLKNWRRYRPALLDPVGALAAGTIPDIPFVETQHHALGRTPLGRNRIGDGDHFVDEAVHQIRTGEERRGVFAVIVQVGMQRDIIGVIESVLDDSVFPMPERRHVARRRSAGRKLDARIDPAHHLGGFPRHRAVGRSGLVFHLPGAIHFIAEAPEFDAVRLLPAVGAAQIRPMGATGMVAVFHEIARGVAAPGAEVDGHHRLDIGSPAPVHELIGAETVGLGAEPCQVEPRRPLLGRSDAVLPIVAGDEIAAGIAHDGGTKLLHQRQHVLPKTFCIGGRMPGLVDAAIDASAEMFDEGTEQTGISVADGKIAIHQNVCFSHVVLGVLWVRGVSR
jgi:hypothetical protein